MVELKDMIRNTRKAQGLTQAQFAHKIGATTNSVSFWELGKATPRIGMLKKMGLYSETQTAKEIGAKRLLDALASRFRLVLLLLPKWIRLNMAIAGDFQSIAGLSS